MGSQRIAGIHNELHGLAANYMDSQQNSKGSPPRTPIQSPGILGETDAVHTQKHMHTHDSYRFLYRFVLIRIDWRGFAQIIISIRIHLYRLQLILTPIRTDSYRFVLIRIDLFDFLPIRIDSYRLAWICADYIPFRTHLYRLQMIPTPIRMIRIDSYRYDNFVQICTDSHKFFH